MKVEGFKGIWRVFEAVDALHGLDDDSLRSSLLSHLETSDIDSFLIEVQRTRDLFIRAAEVLSKSCEQDSRPHAIEGFDVLDSLLAQGLVVSSHEMCKVLGISRQGLYKAKKANRLFSFFRAGQHYYPAFFGNPSFDQVQIQKVCKVLGQLPASAKWQFFNTASYSMNSRTPLQALRAGQFDRVLLLAAAFSEL